MSVDCSWVSIDWTWVSLDWSRVSIGPVCHSIFTWVSIDWPWDEFIVPGSQFIVPECQLLVPGFNSIVSACVPINCPYFISKARYNKCPHENISNSQHELIATSSYIHHIFFTICILSGLRWTSSAFQSSDFVIVKPRWKRKVLGSVLGDLMSNFSASNKNWYDQAS